MAIRIFLFSLTVATLACVPGPLADPEWLVDEAGLPGYAIGTGLSLGPDGVVYAAAYREGAVFTLRPGESWQPGAGLEKLAAYAVAAHPTERAVALAATVGGLYRTRDAGRSWQRIDGIDAAYSVAFDRQGQAWVGAEGGISTLTPAWTLRQVTALLPNETVLSIAPAIGSLYLGTSTGISWLKDGQLHRIFTGRQVVSSIAVDSSDRVIARIEGRLFRYGGETLWIPLSLPGPVLAITSESDRLLAATERNGVLESRDGGTTWQPLGNGIEGTVYAIVAGRPTTDDRRTTTDDRRPPTADRTTASLLPGSHHPSDEQPGARSQNSELRTQNSVQPSTFNLQPSTPIQPSAFSLQPSQSAWAATSHGVFAFDGSQWRPTGPGYGRPMVRALAATDMLWAATSDGVYRRDGGRWQPAGPDLKSVLTLALLPAGDRLFAGTWERGVVQGDGRTWETVTANEYRRAIIPALARSGETIVARVEYARTIRSTDGGRSWSLVDAGLERRTVLSLTSFDGRFWAGTDSGVYLLTGDRWERLPGTPGDGTIPALLATTNGLIVGTSDGLWKPANDGWLRAGLAGHGILSLMTGSGDTLLAGTSDDGVYRFQRGEWRGIGPAGARISAVTIDPQDGSLVVATDSSVLRRRAP